MRKIIITGASGLLGSKLMAIARDDYEVLGQYNKNKFTMKGSECIQLDLCDRDSVFKMVEQYEPDFIIHTAGLRDIDYCEVHQEEAYAANVEATRNLSDVCTQVGTKILYTSTDVIFDGTKSDLKEDSEPNPINYYGKTKLEGESIILENPDNLVARISILFGWNVYDRRLNFVTWLLNNLKLETGIELYTDQYRNGTYMDDAARIFLLLYMRGLKGIYHIACKSCLNRFEMGEFICDVFGYDRELLKPGNSENVEFKGARPKNCCLDVSRAEEDLELNLLSFRECLLDMVRQESEGNVF